MPGRLGGLVVLALVLATAVPAAAAESLFRPYEAYDVGSWPEAVAVGDVNGDGRNDVVMTTSFDFDDANDYRVFVFAQNADGSLAAPVSYATAGTYTTRPESVAVGDVTGDGRADVVVGIDDVGVQVFPQLPTGTLGAPALFASANTQKIRLGHLDGDGRLDVAGVGWGTNVVGVLLNDGAGGFRAPVTYAARHAGYEDLEVADVTGDGRHDIVVMSGQTYAVPNVSVLPQLAGGGFGAAAEYRVGTNVNTQGIGVGDVTGDGRNDVVASYGGNSPAARIAVFAQDAAGALTGPVAYGSYDIPEPVEVADLDLDARADVVTLHGGWYAAGVYRQTAAGTLGGEVLYGLPYASHYNPHGLAVGDVSGDGSPDLVLADHNQGLVVLRGTATRPPPPVADVAADVTASAARVKPRKGLSFTVTASNAGPDPSNVELTVQIAGPVTGLAASGAGCSLAGATVTCSFASLGAGASRSVQINGTAGTRGTVTASAAVDGSADDPNPSNDADSASVQIR